MTRREFVGTAAMAATAGALLRPERAVASAARWEADGYHHKVVARVYDPQVAAGYAFGDAFYWRKFDQARLAAMLATGVMQLTGARSSDAAWKKILPGVSGSSKVVVKVNLNNTRREYKAGALNSSPAMMIVLAKALQSAGMKSENITFLDCSRLFPEEFKSDVLAECPGVQCVGGSQVPSSAAIEMSYGPAYVIPEVVMDADYLISSHLMKKHDGGHTGAMKNFFGMNAGGKVTWAHGKPGWMDSDPIKRMITNAEIKKRLKLCVNEAILAANSPDSLDAYGFGDVFPDGKPSSLFLSRNPFLQDVVGWDFVRAECSRFPCRKGTSIAWLKNCAGSHPNWTEAAIESGELVDGGPGMPTQDMRYVGGAVEYVSRRVG